MTSAEQGPIHQESTSCSKEQGTRSKGHRSLPLATCYLLFLILLVIHTYLPAIALPYGMHNDYLLITPSFENKLPFLESHHLVRIGRGLQAVLLNHLSWRVDHIADFFFIRFLNLIGLIALAGLVTRFIRREYALEKEWATVTFLAILFLPVTQLFVIWSVPSIAGPLNLLLAFYSYYFFKKGQSGRPGLSPFFIATSLILFLAALYIYPTTAFFVFIFSFAAILFSPAANWKQTKTQIFRDLIFFCSITFLYLVSVWLIFVKPDLAAGKFEYLNGTIYDFHATKNIFSKLPLLKEIIVVSASGSWFIPFGQKAALLYGSLLIFLTMEILTQSANSPAGSPLEKGKRRELLERFGFGIFLFLLMNAPALAANALVHIPGLRILFPASLFFLLLLIAALRMCANTTISPVRKKAFYYGALFVVLLNSLLAYQNTFAAARNFYKEARYVKQKAKEANFSRILRFVVIPLPPYQGDSLIETKLPYEFGFTITEHGLGAPVVNEALAEIGKKPYPVFVDPNPVVFIDRYTYLININDARTDGKIPVVVGRVDTSQTPGGAVTVGRVLSYFFFQEMSQNQKLPYWHWQGDSIGDKWFEFIFARPQAFKKFSFQALSPASPPALAVGCQLSVSNDGQSWKNSTLSEVPHPRWGRIYEISGESAWRHYRFYFKRETPDPVAGVSAVEMILEK